MSDKYLVRENELTRVLCVLYMDIQRECNAKTKKSSSKYLLNGQIHILHAFCSIIRFLVKKFCITDVQHFVTAPPLALLLLSLYISQTKCTWAGCERNIRFRGCCSKHLFEENPPLDVMYLLSDRSYKLIPGNIGIGASVRKDTLLNSSCLVLLCLYVLRFVL